MNLQSEFECYKSIGKEVKRMNIKVSEMKNYLQNNFNKRTLRELTLLELNSVTLSLKKMLLWEGIGKNLYIDDSLSYDDSL